MKLQQFLPKTNVSRFLWIVASYFTASALFPNLLLLIVNCIGYLPYSDRPGPGWQPAHWPGKEELEFFIGFALYMGLPTLVYGVAHAVLGLLYSISGLPKWLIRLLGGLTGLLSAGLLMEGAGWMIAISAFGVYVAAGCGLVWGVFILPALTERSARPLPFALRVALPLFGAVGGVNLLIKPLLPRDPVPGINFELNRLTSSQSEVHGDNTPYFDQATWRELDDLHLHGDMHGGIQSAFSGDGKSIDVMIVAFQAIDREYKIEVPSSGHVIYILDRGTLTPHPMMNTKDKRVFLIMPGVDELYDGGQLKTTGQNNFTPFTWSPTIKR